MNPEKGEDLEWATVWEFSKTAFNAIFALFTALEVQCLQRPVDGTFGSERAIKYQPLFALPYLALFQHPDHRIIVFHITPTNQHCTPPPFYIQ